MTTDPKRIHENEQGFRAIVENSPDYIVRYDREFRRIYGNPAAVRVYGFPYEEFVGTEIGTSRQPHEGFSAVENNIAPVKQRLKEVFDSGHPSEFEISWGVPEGEKALSVRLFPEFDHGNVKSVVLIARDISELKETERRILALTENSPDIVARFAVEGRCLYVNRSIEKKLGVDKRELIGTIIGDLLLQRIYPAVPHDVISIRNGIRTVFETGAPFETEISIPFPDAPGVYNIRLIPEFNESTVVSSVLFIGRDISEQRKMEEEKFQSELLFATAFRGSPVALSITRVTDGRFQEVNEKFLSLFGYTREEVIGHTSIELKMYNNEEERTRKVLFLHEQGGVREFEIKTRTKEGREIDVLSSTVEIELWGEPQILSFTIDLTERKRAEEILKENEAKLRTIFDIAPIGICVLDSAGKIIDLNFALEHIVGISKSDLLSGNYKDRRFIDNTNVPISREDLPSSRALTEQRVIKDVEIGSVQNDGTVLWNNVSAAPIPIPGMGVVVLTTSIDERKKTENRLRTARFRLQQLSRRLLEVQENERRMLARELHDEIGQILTVIKIDLQVIREKVLPFDLERRIDDNIVTIEECLRQVRNLSLELRPSMLDDLGLVDAVNWHLKRQAARVGFEAHIVTEGFSSRLPAEIETACYRIVQESLTNIARHAKAHRVDLAIAVNDGTVTLTIRDDGQGFDVDHAIAESAGGTTFGIMSMQERINLLGGHIEISSHKGRGTTVHVTISFHKRTEQ
ncbi:MAG: PAS domain S-box protein [Bacteroidota bacterium]